MCMSVQPVGAFSVSASAQSRTISLRPAFADILSSCLELSAAEKLNVLALTIRALACATVARCDEACSVLPPSATAFGAKAIVPKAAANAVRNFADFMGFAFRRPSIGVRERARCADAVLLSPKTGRDFPNLLKRKTYPGCLGGGVKAARMC